MKKVGSFSSALGFIFLGIWMIIKINNPLLAKELIRWWPMLIVVLGLEILIFSIKASGNEKLRLSGFFIPILIAFLIINTSSGFNIYSNDININIKNLFSKENFNISFNGNWKPINSLKTLEASGTSLDLKCINGDIKLEKSRDKNIYIESTIYVNKSNRLEKYDIPFARTDNGYSVIIDDNFIKSINVTIFLPEGYNINITGDNLQIKSTDSIVKSRVDIDMDNGNVDLRGDIENSNIKLSNGKVYLKNKTCTAISISLDNGSIYLDTEDQNISLDADLDLGSCEFNGERKINSGIKGSIGNGTGSVITRLDNGIIKIYSKK